MNLEPIKYDPSSLCIIVSIFFLPLKHTLRSLFLWYNCNRKPILLLEVLLLIFTLQIAHSQAVFRDILGKRNKVHLDFESHGHLILVSLKIKNRIPLNFIFDTGSAHTILFNKEVTDYLGIPYSDTVQIAGADQSRILRTYVARNVPLQFGEGIRATRDILVLEEDYFQLRRLLGVEVHGILGMDLIKTLAIEINYKHHRISIFRPTHLPKITNSYSDYKLYFRQGKPYIKIPLYLNKSKRNPILAKLLIDTGAGISMMLLNNSHPDIALPSKHIPGFIGSSLGGPVKGYLSRIREVSLGEIKYVQPPVYFQTLDSIRPNISKANGLIGNRFLENYSIILDESHQRLYLHPYSKKQPKYKLDRSGIQLYSMGPKLNKFIVASVVPGSPADLAGILPGDQIIKVGWHPVGWYGLDGLYELFSKKSGKKIKLKLLRNHQNIKVDFRLRDLI